MSNREADLLHTSCPTEFGEELYHFEVQHPPNFLILHKLPGFHQSMDRSLEDDDNNQDEDLLHYTNLILILCKNQFGMRPKFQVKNFRKF